jgi:aspartyl-tRNA(Asn)/glutamyl-tRNA(Gln) amidotransferase subunit C
MAIDAATVRRVAKLARIRETEERLEPLARELNSDTAGVEPMASAVAVKLPLREDVVTEGGDAGAILANAPAKADGFFIVPKVVE